MALRAGCWEINSLRNESHCWHLYKLQSREGKELKALLKALFFSFLALPQCVTQARLGFLLTGSSEACMPGKADCFWVGLDRGRFPILIVGIRILCLLESSLLIYSRLILELFFPGVRQTWKHCRTTKSSLRPL